MKSESFLLIFLVGAILFLTSCNREVDMQREIIRGMETAAQQNPKDEFIRPLVANYLNYCRDFKGDEFCPIYLYRCAVLYYRIGNYTESIIHLESILRDYPETEIQEDAQLTLAMILTKKGNNQARVEKLYKEYLKKYPKGKGLKRAEDFFIPDEQKQRNHINQLLKEFEQLPRGESPSEGKMTELMFAYANFSKSYPNDPLSASYCLQGAQLAVRLGHHLIAIQFLEKIYQDYPAFSEYPQAMLMLAVQYDTNISLYLRKGKVITGPLEEKMPQAKLQQIDPIARGGEIYKEILKKYPEHEVADSARNGLKFLGQKTNEVVEEFIRIQDSIKAAIQ